MVRAELYARALSNASEVLGGPDELSRRLDVSKAVLAGWLERPESMPEAVFLKITEILTEASLQMLNERRVAKAGSPPTN